MPDKNNLKYKKEIEAKLRTVIRKRNIVNAFKGFAVSIIIISLSFLLFDLLEAAENFNSLVRTIFVLILVIIFCVSVIYFIFIPLFKNFPLFSKINYLETSDTVGNYYPKIKDDLKNALQLLEKKNKFFSGSLVDAAFKKVYNKTKALRFDEVISSSFLKKYFGFSAAVFVIVILVVSSVPVFKASASRLINFHREFISPQKFKFEVQPGNASITKGENFKVEIKAMGEVPSYVFLKTKSVEQSEFEEVKLYPDSSGIFSSSFDNVRNSFNYFASAEDISSSIYKVDVISRPVISEFELNINPPAYSGLPMAVQKDNGNINSLPGSRVDLKLVSSKKLSSAAIKFDDDSELKLTADVKNASGKFTIKKDITYKILIEDTEGNINLNPITYTIRALEDSYPEVKIIAPEKDIKITNDNRVAIISKISDDYGFSKFLLHFRLSASRYEQVKDEYRQVSIPFNKKNIEDDIYYVWDLTSMFLAADDVVSYYLEIFDNDIISGPKSAKSPIYTVRVPSLDELFTEADDTYKKSENDLTETLDEAKKLNEELNKISDELKQNSKEITWEEKEKIEDAANKFKELESKVENAQEKLAKMQDDLQENNLLSEETLKKYMELQNLMDELSNDKMKEAFKKLQDMLQKLSRQDVQKAFEDIKMNEDAFQKSLERTINLLKRLQAEQKVDELMKRTEELADKLEQQQNDTEKSDLSDEQKKNKLAGKQDELTDKMKNMKSEMEKLSDLMKELKDMPNEEMKKALDELKKQHNQKISENTKQDLMEQQKNNALQNMKQMSQNMQSMKQQMEQLQSAMQRQNQMQVFNDMMKIMDNLVTLSKQEERLKSESNNLVPNSPRFNEMAQKQDEIQKNLGKVLRQLSDLSQKTFAITPEMGKALGNAHSDMSQSISAMQGKNGALAFQKQKGAMKSLNEAASLMQGAMNQMMQGGQGGGMMSLLQQMQQLSQQQMGLNKLTKMLQQGQMSQQQLSQMQRLANEQKLIQKSLEQLNKESKESGQSKEITADLDKVLEEMQEVITGMQTQKIDDDLVQTQERILSKLLDAQRSINERDFEKRRQSSAGDNFARKSPPELNLSTDEGRQKLKDELLKSVREGYAKDYEELIRKYFEALQKDQGNN